jgi:amidophosphoribosyltransferase
MCGIVGAVKQGFVNQDLYDGLVLLQHRGQDAAGMMTCAGNQIFLRKSNGLVRDVLRTNHMLRLTGNMGIGHVRYPTAGSDSVAEAQPFYVNSPYGIALAHNGNLTNSEAIKQDLWNMDRRHLNTTSDSEVLLNVFAHELEHVPEKHSKPAHIFAAVKGVYHRCHGGYAVVAMIVGFGIVGFRDPYGIRPLVIGRRTTTKGDEYMLASESVVLHALGYVDITDVKPGEAVFITQDGQLYRQECITPPSYSPCIFEHVYLARPDSIIDKISVYKVRLKLGDHLADKILREWPDHDIDVVMPVPDTSRTAAYSLSLRLGLKYREGLVKNHYIGRTFIMPGQGVRRKSVRQKLNTLELEFKDKNVLLVDDSIVRGTTCKEIVQMAREAGAKKVYFASAAPMVQYPNVYGIDMPSAQELIAHNRTVEQVCEAIGADGLLYQDLSALIAAAREGNPDIHRFEDSVFTGDYITGDVDQTYLSRLDHIRNDAAKHQRAYFEAGNLAVNIHNDE